MQMVHRTGTLVHESHLALKWTHTVLHHIILQVSKVAELHNNPHIATRDLVLEHAHDVFMGRDGLEVLDLLHSNHAVFLVLDGTALDGNAFARAHMLASEDLRV